MKERAFTLVEILVVVTIIALLATFGAISYSQFIKQSRDARRRTDIEQIRASIEMYRSFDSLGQYPTTIQFGTGDIKDATATYLSKVPNDPLPANTYYYLVLDSNRDYLLCTYLEGGGLSVAGTVCGSSSLQCNYCMGPYGQK